MSVWFGVQELKHSYLKHSNTINGQRPRTWLGAALPEHKRGGGREVAVRVHGPAAGCEATLALVSDNHELPAVASLRLAAKGIIRESDLKRPLVRLECRPNRRAAIPRFVAVLRVPDATRRRNRNLSA